MILALGGNIVYAGGFKLFGSQNDAREMTALGSYSGQPGRLTALNLVSLAPWGFASWEDGERL